ncbi:helix-turn-helix transcriptional regulator [Sinorhizobium fredii]|uniref:helix-turn-helix transcriptional regulator n=1 Tax=Rhizobium fredii TaxID=380 RepID=UPI003512CE6A
MLAVARLILGQTQAEVAEHSGISPRTIYMIEKGAAGIASVEKLVPPLRQMRGDFSRTQWDGRMGHSGQLCGRVL